MSNIPNERWIAIIGLEGFYEVSDLGRARSCGRIGVDKSGARKFFAGISLKLNRNKGGYFHFMASVNAKTKTVHIHQAVMQAFTGSQQKGIEVRHKNGDKSDNRLCNLEYGTRQDNVRDAIRMGEYHRGDTCSWAKLTADQVLEICKHTGTLEEMSVIFGVSAPTLSLIKTRKIWKHLTDGVEIVWAGSCRTSKLTKEQWLAFHRSGKTARQVSEETGITYKAVWQALRRLKVRDAVKTGE
jgi:hypothetical protein